MNRYPLQGRLRMAGNQLWLAVKSLLRTYFYRQQRIRISFDVDDTLACHFSQGDAECSRLPAAVHRWLGEPLRSGTRELARELRRRGCSIWVYTSSGRTPAYVRRWLLLYGVRIDGVVNSVLHKQALTAHGFTNSPSKFPPAFAIDLHVDDSEGVRLEGYDHGFRVVVVQPDDTQWAQRILDAVAELQAQLHRQQLLSGRVAQLKRAEVFSS